MRIHSKAMAAVLAGAIALGGLCGCTESRQVSYNISQEADNFNVVRRITVINSRSDAVLFQMTGTFSIHTNDKNELEVTCELPDGKFAKHFVYLNEWTCYTVEDLNGTSVEKYTYQMNFLPQEIQGVTITTRD